MRKRKYDRLRATVLLLSWSGTLLAVAPVTGLAGQKNSGWKPPEPAVQENGDLVTGGCPHESPDGKYLYTASMLAGNGTLDVWVYDRNRRDKTFSAPEMIPKPVSLIDYDDFCPTPVGGTKLFFVSTRGSCGGGDIFFTTWHPAKGWQEPEMLGCGEDGPNTMGGEFSPSYVKTDEGTYLYYSSNGTGNHDIYRSKLGKDGKFGPGKPVEELNTGYDDRMPNVRKDGLEIVYSSAQPSDGEANPTQDVFVATRKSTRRKFSGITNLSETVPFSTVGMDETRVTMSRDGKRLYYGAAGTIYTSKRPAPRSKHKCDKKHEHKNGKCDC